MYILKKCIIYNPALYSPSRLKGKRQGMIALQKLNGEQFVLNSDLIECIESTPDTLVTLSNGKKFLVSNTIEDIVRKAIKYRQLCAQALQILDRRGEAGPASASAQGITG